MALTLTLPSSAKYLANIEETVTMVDANHTAATDVAWVDMRDSLEIVMSTTAVALTGNGVTAFTIVANTNSAGTGDEEILKTHAVGSAPDALGDTLYLSLTAAEIAAASGEDGVLYRWVSAKITAHNANDDTLVVYRRCSKHPEDGKTADAVA